MDDSDNEVMWTSPRGLNGFVNKFAMDDYLLFALFVKMFIDHELVNGKISYYRLYQFLIKWIYEKNYIKCMVGRNFVMIYFSMVNEMAHAINSQSSLNSKKQYIITPDEGFRVFDNIILLKEFKEFKEPEVQTELIITMFIRSNEKTLMLPNANEKDGICAAHTIKSSQGLDKFISDLESNAILEDI